MNVHTYVSYLCMHACMHACMLCIYIYASGVMDGFARHDAHMLACIQSVGTGMHAHAPTQTRTYT